MFGSLTTDSWAARTYGEIAELANQPGSIMMVPVGSTEQHGHHLPVGTDTILVESVAESALERLHEVPVLTTEPVWSGYSPHHLSFGGTLSLEFDTLLKVLEQVAETGLGNGFDAILFLNGHGGNIPLIGAATSTIGVAHPDAEVLGTTYFQLAEPFVDEIRDSPEGGMAHGGEFETSLMLHFQPELVDEDRLEGEVLEEPYVESLDDMFAGGPLEVYRGFESYSDSGAIGDPGSASAEKGRELAEGLTEKVASMLESIHDRNSA